jgi:hypothetical protein
VQLATTIKQDVPEIGLRKGKLEPIKGVPAPAPAPAPAPQTPQKQ